MIGSSAATWLHDVRRSAVCASLTLRRLTRLAASASLTRITSSLDPGQSLRETQYEAIVPTVADRIAQTVVRLYLEPKVEPVFHPDSYGYRPGRSALVDDDC